VCVCVCVCVYVRGGGEEGDSRSSRFSFSLAFVRIACRLRSCPAEAQMRLRNATGAIKLDPLSFPCDSSAMESHLAAVVPSVIYRFRTREKASLVEKTRTRNENGAASDPRAALLSGLWTRKQVCQRSADAVRIIFEAGRHRRTACWSIA